MAFGYSDNFNFVTDGVYEPGRLASPGRGKLIKKRMYKNLGSSGTYRTNGDQLVLGKFKSGDRLFDLRVTSSAANVAGVVDLGLKKANLDWDPTTMSLVAPAGATSVTDLFYDGQVLSTALSRSDAFVQATDLANIDRGKQLWELVDKKITAGAGTVYGADPNEDWALIMLFATGASATALEIMVEADVIVFG